MADRDNIYSGGPRTSAGDCKGRKRCEANILDDAAVRRLVELSDRADEQVSAPLGQAARYMRAGYHTASTGHRLREIRQAARLTQTEVAAKLGLTQARVSQIENGDADGESGLSIGTATEFASACGFEFEVRFVPQLSLSSASDDSEATIPLENAYSLQQSSDLTGPKEASPVNQSSGMTSEVVVDISQAGTPGSYQAGPASGASFSERTSASRRLEYKVSQVRRAANGPFGRVEALILGGHLGNVNPEDVYRRAIADEGFGQWLVGASGGEDRGYGVPLPSRGWDGMTVPVSSGQEAHTSKRRSSR